MKESDLKRQILEYLRYKYPKSIFWNQRTTGIKKPNGAWIPSSLPGVSDILGCLNFDIDGIRIGVMTAIEVKLPGNKPTPAQTEFLRRIKEAGGIGIIVCSVEDVENELLKQISIVTIERYNYLLYVKNGTVTK